MGFSLTCSPSSLRCYLLASFVRLFYAAFLPPMLHNGVAFEAHPQNTVLRVSLEEPEPKLLGFIIRDFGGLRIHPPTLLSSTHPKIDTPIDEIITPGHSILADTLDDVYTRMYHTVVHNHFQQLVRVLGLHYNGKGWDIVRERLREALSAEEYNGKAEGLREAWFGGEGKERWAVPGKCFMRMRMVGMYRHVSISRFLCSLLNSFAHAVICPASARALSKLAILQGVGTGTVLMGSLLRNLLLVSEPRSMKEAYL